MTKPPKPVRAWMIVERSTGAAAVKDHRVPVYWFRYIAENETRADECVVRVAVVPDPPPRAKRKGARR